MKDYSFIKLKIIRKKKLGESMQWIRWNTAFNIKLEMGLELGI